MGGVEPTVGVWSKSVSSTKLHPTNLVVSFDSGVERETPNPNVRIIFRSGVLMRAQIVGLAPLPWPEPWTGFPSTFVAPYDALEMPWIVFNEVLHVLECLKHALDWSYWHAYSLHCKGGYGVENSIVA